MKPTDRQLYKRLLSYAWPYKRFFFISFIGFLLYATADMLLADLVQYMIDSLGDNINPDKKNGIIVTFMHQYMSIDVTDHTQAQYIIPILILAFSLQRAIGSFLGNFFMKYVGNHVVFDIRQEVFAKMVRLPVSYIEEHSQGSLVSRITFNVNQVTGAVTNAITILFRDGLTVIVLLGYLIYLNWKLTLMFLLVAPFIGLIVSFVSRRFRRLSKKLQQSMGGVTHTVSESISGARDLRIYGAQDIEIQKFDEVSRRTLTQQMKIILTDALFSPTVQYLLAIAISLLVLVGLTPSVIETMSAGVFVTFLGAAGGIAKPIRQLTNILNIIQKALAAAEDIFALLDTPEEEAQEDGREQAQQDKNSEAAEHLNLKGDVSFDNVGFAYSEESGQVLSKVSFNAEAGSIIALVGASGGGKSTLMSLLPRFYNATEGTITIDGHDISQLSLKELRHQIALVDQQVVLLNDTIYNNLAFGEMQCASEEEVIRAAKLAHAHEFILEMEDGYQTDIGDNGVRLSGGQRQRLAIARAILKKAPILIMDEATSALDNESERAIQEAMEEVTKGRTTFIIAHRLSTIEHADKIIVMQNGQVAEEGNHHSLLEKQGVYFDLHKSSSLEN